MCQTTPARAVPDPVRQDLPQLFKQVQDLLTSNSENTRSVQAAVADLAAEIGKLLVAVKKLRVGGRSR